MRAVVQRVARASVSVEQRIVGQIETGLLVYVGVGQDDGPDDAAYLAGKIGYLRIFQDDGGKMNLDVRQVGGAVLLVSNFTLCADVRHGRRPAFTGAAPPEKAEPLYVRLAELLRDSGVAVETGSFGAMMSVVSENAGPVNILLDSKQCF